MIKGIVLDVDGVLVGDTPGFNFPHPHNDVIKRLSEIRQKNIPIVLCTGKGNFAIESLVKDANLNNPHIADGGSMIINPIEKKVIKTSPIHQQIVKDIIHVCIQNNVYVEVYAQDNYYVQKNQENTEVTKKHAETLQKDPILPDDLEKTVENIEIVNMIAIADNENDKKRIESVLQPFVKNVELIWTLHPSLLPHQFYLITAKGVSKKAAVEEIFLQLNIPFTNVLAVGDTMGDWNFMQLCAYVGVMGNAPDILKQKAREKDENKFYIAGPVEENGILDIFNYFTAEI